MKTRERPIMFKTQMVQAIRQLIKTNTRRPIIKSKASIPTDSQSEVSNDWKQPYGKLGDRLWVKETYLLRHAGKTVLYKADLDPIEAAGIGALYGGWKSSMFMPRKHSRLLLEIQDVRVERVQDISEEDARAEGVDSRFEVSIADFMHNKKWDAAKASTYRLGFKQLWDEIYSKKPALKWEANPWVYRIQFELLESKTN